MADALQGTGIDSQALQRYVDEQIYTLPGTDRHREQFSVLLTGSRATGSASPESDLDVDVVCPRQVYNSVLRASFNAGIIRTDRAFLCVLRDGDWHRYFGEEKGCPHFSLTPLESVEEHFREYNDTWLWIWTKARIVVDPGAQFQRIRDGFQGYPRDVLIRKIKYHWLRAGYASITAYPHHDESEESVATAAAAVLTTVYELLRFFLLVEGKPFPYPKELMRHAEPTALGKEFCPLLRRAVSLVVGSEATGQTARERCGRAMALLLEPGSPEACRLEEACRKAMIAAAVDPQWVEADYANIDELLLGELGPMS